MILLLFYVCVPISLIGNSIILSSLTVLKSYVEFPGLVTLDF
jgi:hypothetical protein